ncbi:retrovirus-related Pol polyprotein from transposon gypsy [Trichinella spiralis]|uniref:retrovirus-related Pol polyprotein from transposon gypsy n=1 Tax=Trichinella spiralis TaxID=6334 RepID=UPI0001EFE1FC|nr:retrovirus-related Pol polyprotein from transposon gypsy [Trichinella spiralis]
MTINPFPIRESLYQVQTGGGEIKKIFCCGSKVHQRRKSCSPWRAQALVVTSDNHKKRMIIDYSQTINRFTLLHAYPLPKINDMVQAISKYHFFSTVDLKRAYYQIPINARDKPYTAFEAGGRLYQFKRIPFGVMNGAACFQRVMDNILRVEKLKDSFVYVDNVTICGMNEEDHDKNLNRYRELAEKYNQTLIRTNIKLLGYIIEQGTLKPDPERFKPLQQFPLPSISLQQHHFEECLGCSLLIPNGYLDSQRKYTLWLDAQSFPCLSQLWMLLKR